MIKEITDSIEDHGGHIYFFKKDVMYRDSLREAGWYFLDETWAEFVGPYQTKKSCEEGMIKYAIMLEGGSS